MRAHFLKLRRARRSGGFHAAAWQLEDIHHVRRTIGHVRQSPIQSQKVFGVSTIQASDSAYRVYNAHGGSQTAGLGFSATRFITPHWLINSDMARNHLLGNASDSPITQANVQGILEISTEYRW
jgi:outer membrane scaffolding protein for murein synthesis (MipA/OmpV family)